MFPYITLRWINIYMTWVWIIVSLFIFLFLVKYYANKFKLDFWKFFDFFPLMIWLSYILWNYFHYFFSSALFFPLSVWDLFLLISPYWFNFSFIWVSLWLLISIVLFLKKVKISSERLKRIDVLLYAISLSLVFFWVFLTLWDNFIWRQTDSYISITSFMEESKLNMYSKVYPVWLFLSIVSLLTFIITFILQFTKKKHWLWIVWFIILILMLNVIFFFQKYDQHIVSSRFWISLLWRSFDIKNYWTIILSLLSAYYYLKLTKVK